jgi:hypothetical protein
MLDSEATIGWAALAAMVVFVAYVGAALYSMQHRTLFILGGVAVLLAFVGVFLQAAFVRWRLGKLDDAQRAHPADVTGGSGDDAHNLRAYAVRASPSFTQQARRRLPPPALVDTAFVMCGSRAGAAPAEYTDARYVAIMRGGQGDALRDDVLSGRVRYVVASNAVWRISALQDTDVEVALAHSAFECAIFILAEASTLRLTAGGEGEGRSGRSGRSGCAIPPNTLPLTLTTGSHLDELLDATGAGDVTLHVWGYGWAGGTSP